MNKTYTPKIQGIAKWYLVDANGKTLGRLASQVSNILRGKHDQSYTPYCNSNHYVIIINSSKIIITGQKKKQKKYARHSGYPGGLYIETFEQLQARAPEKVIEKAIKNMLPKGTLGKQLYRNLKVYSEDKHPHIAQQPNILKF